MILFFFFLNKKKICNFFFFFQAEDGIRDGTVTGVQTCALPISPVDEDQELVCDRIGLIEAACADRVLVGVDSRHLEIRRESQRLGDTRGSRAANIVPGDDKDGSGCVRQALGAPRYRGDLEIGELLQAEVGQVEGLAGLSVGRESGQCGNGGYADARCVNAFFFFIDLNYPSQVSETETE